MRRLSKSSTDKLSADGQRLIMLAVGLSQASSRLEERTWGHSLDELLNKILKSGHQELIDAALEHLFKTDLLAYDVLLEAAEAGSESCSIELGGSRYDALLVALPILAWTRFSIASGTISDEVRMTLCCLLRTQILAPNTQVAMAPTLFAIDQLPRTHVDTLALTIKMSNSAVKGTALRPLCNPPETASFLADTRYLLVAIAAHAGPPLFKWQATMEVNDRQQAFEQWKTEGTPHIAALLPGCGVDLLMPEAYYTACREADRNIRPVSIRAAVHYLTHTLSTESNSLRAVIGGFSEEPLTGSVDEYRIGFTLRQNPDVLYGVIWPLYGETDDGDNGSFDTLLHPRKPSEETWTPLERILALLKDCGITHIKRHNEIFAIEFCDDCGAPLYPDPEGELVHAEMPDDIVSGVKHFH